MSKYKFYLLELQEFLNKNIKLFESAKKYEESSNRSEHFKYIPNIQNRKDPDFIGNVDIFKEFMDRLFNELIMDEDITFDFNGHMNGLHNKRLIDVINEDKNNYFTKGELLRDMSIRVIFDLFKLYVDKNSNKHLYDRFYSSLFMMGDNIIAIFESGKCYECGTYLNASLDYDTKKVTTVYLEVEKCVFENEIPDFVNVDLKAPSKKLVFLNDPRNFIKLDREDKYKVSINSLLGCIKDTEMYADKNIGYFYIGNCMPSILQKEGEIVFTNNYDSENEFEDLDNNIEYKDYSFKGNVCADLWWYTVLDYDLFSQLCKERNINKSDITHTIVDISSDSCNIVHSLDSHKKGYSKRWLSKIKY